MILDTVERRLAVTRGLGGACLVFAGVDLVHLFLPTSLLGLAIRGGGSIALHGAEAAFFLRVGIGLWGYQAWAFRWFVGFNLVAAGNRLLTRALGREATLVDVYGHVSRWSVEWVLIAGTVASLWILNRELTPQFRRGRISSFA